jgi:hypothetical protein
VIGCATVAKRVVCEQDNSGDNCHAMRLFSKTSSVQLTILDGCAERRHYPVEPDLLEADALPAVGTIGSGFES